MQNIRLIDGKLVIPKFLEGIEIFLHRPLEGTIEFATISKNKAGQYHVSITVTKDIEVLPQSKNNVGICWKPFVLRLGHRDIQIHCQKQQNIKINFAGSPKKSVENRKEILAGKKHN